ncbi:MAG: hypothetical protein MUE41_17175, partial [Gemmatimonadaceae bacterium]|nr:hypothetical protein [Gemmatimonadaceae bacterium]
ILSAANSLQFAQTALTGPAKDTRNCELVKESQASLTDAQMQISKNGKSNPQLAQTLMGPLMQLMPYGEQLYKAFSCK